MNFVITIEDVLVSVSGLGLQTYWNCLGSVLLKGEPPIVSFLKQVRLYIGGISE